MIRTLLLVCLAAAALSLGALYAHEHAQTQTQAARIAQLEAQVKTQAADLQKQTQTAKVLTEEKTKLAARMESTRKRLAEARTAAAAAPTPVAEADPAKPAEGDAPDAAKSAAAGGKKAGGPLNGYLAKMMKDPAMKNMMRTTQGAAIRQMYSDLVKQWSLSPDEANTFYDMLLERQMGMLAAVSKSPDEVVAQNKSADDALKASLGDQMYDQYKTYEKTVGDRAMLSQLKQRLDSDSAPALSADQTQAVMNAMTDERDHSSTPPGANLQAKIGQGRAISDEEIADFTTRQTAANDKVAARLASVLTPAQLTSFKQYQSQMLDIQKMGMTMASKMSGEGP